MFSLEYALNELKSEGNVTSLNMNNGRKSICEQYNYNHYVDFLDGAIIFGVKSMTNNIADEIGEIYIHSRHFNCCNKIWLEAEFNDFDKAFAYLNQIIWILEDNE